MLTDDFADQLGLTEQQKQQIIPILKEEVPKLKALKNDASLSGADKVRQLRRDRRAVDAKITPLLNPEQQQKFQTCASTCAGGILEKAGGELTEKVETEAMKVF